MRSVALALTHFNRFDMIMECLAPVIDDPRIGEIVISDDHSLDGSYENLELTFAGHPKVRLFRNTVNLDCYQNKFVAVARTSFPYVILFDSDNIMGKDYLDTLFALPEWKENTIYCPDFAQPHFNFRHFSGATVTRVNVATSMAIRHFPTMLNAANYLVPRKSYMDVWQKYGQTTDPHTADSIFMAYNWLLAGNQLHVVKGLQYQHRIHEGSHYKQNVHKTGTFATEIENKLKTLR